MLLGVLSLLRWQRAGSESSSFFRECESDEPLLWKNKPSKLLNVPAGFRHYDRNLPGPG